MQTGARARADTVPAMAAAAQVLDMVLVTVLHILTVKPAAGDQIVEINFEKVGIKKTMANFAPLTKITAEE